MTMLRRLWERRWVQQTVFVITALAAAVGLAGLAWLSGYLMLARSVWGVGFLAVQFLLGLALIRAMLSLGHPILGVARTLIDEAIRMKVALVLIILLVIIVPLLPAMLDPRERLAYRISTFLTYAMIVTSILLSFMTVFLACGTIAYELRERQIFLSMTKPLGRGQYLLGKWLGIALMNLLLLSVAGTGIYHFAHTLEQHGRPLDDLDKTIVTEEVLVARASATPQFPGALNEAVEKTLERAQTEYPDFLANMSLEQARQKIAQDLVTLWHTIARNNTSAYLFTGLQDVKTHSAWVHLRIKPRSMRSPPNGMVQLVLRVNDRWMRLPPIADDAFWRVPIEAALISAKGELRVEIANVNPDNPQYTFDSSIQFKPGEGLELLYPVSSFGPNLAKGLFVLWVRLCCLAMLGLAAGTFLGFPIASLLTLMIYIAAASSGFIGESLQWYAAVAMKDDLPLLDKIGVMANEIWAKASAGDIGDLLRFALKGIGTAFMSVVPSFGDLDPVPLISDGRNVPTAMLWHAFWQVGLLWTGVVGVAGWLIFRRRELARVIV